MESLTSSGAAVVSSVLETDTAGGDTSDWLTEKAALSLVMAVPSQGSFSAFANVWGGEQWHVSG